MRIREGARARARLAAIAAMTVLTACGGGGGGGAMVGGGGGGGGSALSVSGDMLAMSANRGWTYHGNISGYPAVTFSVYADPPSGSTSTFVLFAAQGTVATAFSAPKIASVAFQNSGSGYNATSYVLLNNDGSIYSQGSIPSAPMLVPQTLTQGQSFAPYPGATATVTSVGAVPGAGACPTPANGATVQYAYAGQVYSVSYVPGCGITQYVGNHGEALTLFSVGNYPQLGTQSARRMSTLTVMDTVLSLAKSVASGKHWQPIPSSK